MKDVLLEAVTLIGSGNPALFQTAGLSLYTSVIATIIAGFMGVSLGFWLGWRKFPGYGLLVGGVRALMGMPPVLVGVLVFLLLSRSGPVGRHWYFLFTPAAIIAAQVILAFPIVTGFILVAMEEQAGRILLTIRGLGASPWQARLTLLKELRHEIGFGLATAFSRVIAEVGAVMLVGGDIEGFTRVLTTAMVLETRKGNFEKAVALGLILLIIAFCIHMVLYFLERR